MKMFKSVLKFPLLFVILSLPARCWSGDHKSRFFNGAVLIRKNRAFKGDTLKKLDKLSEFQCAQSCLLERSCISQTFCEIGRTKRGVCYLHDKGITDERDDAVTIQDGCIFQQYVDFHEAQCTAQCKHEEACFYDNSNARFSCACEAPYHGVYCEQSQGQSFLFTTLGATGNAGPKSTAGYDKTSLQGTVTLFEGQQLWQVPFSAVFTLTVAGAAGGDANVKGGHGAVVTGNVKLLQGTVLRILVGQRGNNGPSFMEGAGGGGGTFVVFSDNTPLAVAGGGGGGGARVTSITGDDGQSSTNGSVNGGSFGSGGLVCSAERNDAGGGGGFLGNGSCSISTSCEPRVCSQGGLSFQAGGLGGTGISEGGFGGGGAADKAFPGGGGGYSGGGVNVKYLGSKAGGGGSYWTGRSSVIAGSQHREDGYVLIQYFGKHT